MSRISIGFSLITLTASALAHQPTLSDGAATSSETAIVFDDIQLSRVVYHEVTDDARQLWLTFDVDRPQSLFITLGVPLIERLASFRPAFAVLGPGLPNAELPFEIPPGLGGLVFRSDDVGDPEVFYEPFTGTTSWILLEADVELAQAGTYYIVAYVPSGENGKLWIAPGEREEFSLDDFLGLSTVLRQVRSFHEVSPGGFPCFILPFAALTALALLLRCDRGAMIPSRIMEEKEPSDAN